MRNLTLASQEKSEKKEIVVLGFILVATLAILGGVLWGPSAFAFWVATVATGFFSVFFGWLTYLAVTNRLSFDYATEEEFQEAMKEDDDEENS